MRTLVASSTTTALLKTRDTVAMLTFAAFATSLIVTIGMFCLRSDVNVYINGQKKCNRLHGWEQKNEHLHCSHQPLFFGMIALILVVVKGFFIFCARFLTHCSNGL